MLRRGVTFCEVALDYLEWLGDVKADAIDAASRALGSG